MILLHPNIPTSSLHHCNKQCVNLSSLCPLPLLSQPTTKQHHLKLAFLNICSLNKKSLILNEFITDSNLDIFCFTETWHKPLGYFSLAPTTPSESSYIDKPLLERGVLLLFTGRTLKTPTASIPIVHSFDQFAFKLYGPSDIVRYYNETFSSCLDQPFPISHFPVSSPLSLSLSLSSPLCPQQICPTLW